MERRNKSRLDVQLVCRVDAGRVHAKAVQAFTENVSRTGILMRWLTESPLPKLDGQLVVDIELPENSEFGPRVMRCTTTVVRISAGDNSEPVVALRVHGMTFVKKTLFEKTAAPALADLSTMPAASNRVI